MNKKLTIYTDGGARGNPGPAGIGIVICDEKGNLIKTFSQYLGEMTNNQAEYKALIEALNVAQKFGADSLVCNLDSELVVRQLQGRYKVREPGLQPLAAEVLALTAKFSSVQFVHVMREKNKLADKLVNEALDKEEKI